MTRATLKGAKRRRYYVERTGKNGWSRWVTPVMRKYLMVCCDCSLVHEMQFQALKVRGETTQRRFTADVLGRGYRVAFRVRRRNGLTKNARR